MRYEDAVRKICGEDWKTISPEEKDGGYGVACLKAFIRGCRPSVADLIAHLSSSPDEVVPDDIIAPYTRLLKAGVFSREYGARKDSSLNEQSDQDYIYAWAQMAAISGGFVSLLK